jgi:hypothetical protein
MPNAHHALRQRAWVGSAALPGEVAAGPLPLLRLHRLLLRQHLLQARQVFVGDLGLHRAMLGTTHRAELGLLVDFGGQGFVVVFAGPLGIQ